MRHRHERDAEVTIRMHRGANAERPANLGQLLHLSHAPPVVVVAQDNLHRVLPNRLGMSPNDVTATLLARRDAIRHKPAPHLCHPVQSHAGILEVAAPGKFLAKSCPTFTDVDRPGAIRIDAKRHRLAKRWRSWRMVSTSTPGSRTPPLNLIDPKPYCSRI